MVATIRLKINFDDAVRRWGETARKQVRFAAAKTLTGVAKKGQQATQKEIGNVFNNATPWIKNSVFITPAHISNLEAVVGIKDKGVRATPAHYLREHLAAGARGNKPMEKAMRSMGILPPGWLAVPSKNGVQRDAYGNVSKTTLARILRAISQKKTATRGAITSRVFVIRPGVQSHLEPGIWSATRAGDQSVIKPVFLFVQEASYRKVMDLEKIVGRVVAQEFQPMFSAALDAAMRSAR